MKLRRLDLLRSRGLDAPIRLEDLSPGFNLVVGPNGSGKSSLCRAIAALLWKTEDFTGAVQGLWSVAGEEREVRRESGAPPRWEGGDARPPALPDGVYRGCFSFSVDDFLTDTATEGEIHRVIRTELSAGFDMARVLADRKRYGAGASTVSQRKSELVTAGHRVEDLKGAHGELWRQEQSLDGRRRELQEARQALNETPLYQQALELAGKRVELSETEAALGEYPEAMARLRGDEAQGLGGLQAEQATLERDLGLERERSLSAERALEKTGLETQVPAEVLHLLGEREDELRRAEQELASANTHEAQAIASIEEARRALRQAGGPARQPEFSEERWRLFETRLRDLQRLQARRDDLEARAHEGPEEGTQPAELPCGEALTILSRWLGGGQAQDSRARVAALGALFAGALSILLGLFGATSALASIGIGAAVMAFGALQLVRGPRGERAQREREFQALPLEPPTSWEAPAVVRRMSELQLEMAGQEGRRFAREKAREAGIQLEKLELQVAQLSGELDGLALECGVQPETSRAGVATIAAELMKTSDATHALARSQALKQEAKAVQARALGAAAELLARFGLEAPRDSAELRARKEALVSLESRRVQAGKDIEMSRERVGSLEQMLAQNAAKRAAFLEERGLARLDEQQLAQRLEQLEVWKRVRGRRDELLGDVRRLEQSLEQRPELAGLDVDEARRAFEENRALADHFDALRDEVAEITAAIEAARKGHDLEEALAQEQQAREKLQETRDELFEAVAADFLIDSVARDHQSLAQPGLLQEVGRLFAEFTRHRYELRSAPYSNEGDLPFEIHETDGPQKAFGELSSGTRSQLGLALRIAVARSVEVGEALPLVLDEALTNSDPARFRDVVCSLVDLARQGRQILFLTADDADAARLEQVLREEGFEGARRFELGQLRDGARRAESVETLRLPAVPAPEPGEAAADYAARLEVPVVDLFAGVDALHLFYLCSDDLEGLHEVLRERVETVGKTRSLLAAQADVWRPERRERFEGLCAVAAAWLDHHRIGRSPEVAPEVLRTGPVGTTKYIDDLVDICLELEGDGAALIRALELPAKERDPRLKGFRKSKLEELRLDLEERGLFTADEVASPEERVERCLAAAQGFVARGALSREDVVQLANAFEQWLA